MPGAAILSNFALMPSLPGAVWDGIDNGVCLLRLSVK